MIEHDEAIKEIYRNALNYYTEADLKRMLTYFDIKQKDIDTLRNTFSIVKEIPDSIFDEFFNHLLKFPETSAILRKKENQIEHLKTKTKECLKNILKADFDMNYVKEKLTIGMIHYKMGVKEDYYIGAYSEASRSINLYAESFLDCQQRIDFANSLTKIILLDINLTLKFYFYVKAEGERYFKNLSEKDYLTGLYNREKFEQIAERIIYEAKRYGRKFSLIMFDIDNFKSVNDTFGHDTGDMLLKEIAAIVGAQLRKSDYFIRWGGDEFIIILPETDIGSACNAAEKIRKFVENHKFSIANHTTISLGAVQYTAEENYRSLFKRLDNALYMSKSKGKNAAFVSENRTLIKCAGL